MEDVTQDSTRTSAPRPAQQLVGDAAPTVVELTHLAFCAGWPESTSALAVAEDVVGI